MNILEKNRSSADQDPTGLFQGPKGRCKSWGGKERDLGGRRGQMMIFAKVGKKNFFGEFINFFCIRHHRIRKGNEKCRTERWGKRSKRIAG